MYMVLTRQSCAFLTTQAHGPLGGGHAVCTPMEHRSEVLGISVSLTVSVESIRVVFAPPYQGLTEEYSTTTYHV